MEDSWNVVHWDYGHFGPVYDNHLRVLTEALALVSGAINEDLGGDDVTKGDEHLHELGISELLGQMVDEEITAFGS
jgi:hypothetical protein